MLGLPGDPKPHGNMRSPFRDERTPSFSIHDDSHGWKDHGTGEGGDGVEFARVALRTDHAGVRDWWLERSGIDYYDHGTGRTSSRPPKAPQPRKVIEWPAELVTGSQETWDAFAKRRGIFFAAVYVAVHVGLLRFCRIEGKACFAITDASHRCAEIRRWDGSLFGQSKAFPLPGVDKAWLPGVAMLEGAPRDVGVFITEGCTDLLTALSMYATYRRSGGKASWAPAGIFGASCKTLAPEAAELIRGRRCRIVPDADDAGDMMVAHWKPLLLALGCTVDVVKLPRGSDLTDVAGDIEPETLFSL